MIKRGTIICCLLFVSINSNAQLQNYQIGSRINSLGNIGVSLVDTWAMYHNQASLAYLEDYEVAAYYSNRFGMEETGNSALGIIIPLKNITFSGGLSHYGFRLYNDVNASLSAGKRLGKYLSIGARINYTQNFIGDQYEGLRGLYSELSILSIPFEAFTIGLRISNPIGTKYLNDKNKIIPMIYCIGFNYNYHQKLILGTQIDFQTLYKPSLRFGIEFNLVSSIYLRSGVDISKNEFAFGLGYTVKKLRCNIGFQQHQVLGYSPNISLNYEL